MTNYMHTYPSGATDPIRFRDDDPMDVESSSESGDSLSESHSTSGSPTPGPQFPTQIQSDDLPIEEVTTLLTCGNCSHDVVLSGQLITSGILLVPETPVPHILYTNATPATHEEPQIHSYIQRTSKAIAQLDWEIARINAILQVLVLERDKLVHLVEEHKALLTPFRKIPADILTEIFVRCERGAKRDVVPDVPDSFDRDAGPLLLTQVCQRWRDHALRMPELWTNIRVRVGRGELQESRRLPLLHAWLERSSNHPLNVCMVERQLRSPVYNSDSRNLAVGMLVSAARRWKRLYLALHSITVHWPLFAGLKGLPLPALQHCTVVTPPEDLVTDSGPPNEILTNLLSGAGALTSLALDYNIPILGLKYPRQTISHLDLYTITKERSIPVQMAFDTLSHCPRLVSLRVRCHVPGPFVPSSHLYHSHLSSLDLQIDTDSGPGAESLLTHITPPNLVHLALCTPELEWDQDTIMSFLTRCAPLHSLTLRCKKIEKRQLLEMLGQTKELKSLILDIGLNITNDLLSDLVVPTTGAPMQSHLPPRILVPRLKYLELGGRLFISDNDFLSLITSRRYPLPQSDVTVLDEVHIDCDGLVYGFMTPYLVDQLDELRWEGLRVRIVESGSVKYP